MKTYLGDAVYVEPDVMGIKLTTSNGESDTNTIYLEPEVIAAFVEYLKKLGYAVKNCE